MTPRDIYDAAYAYIGTAEIAGPHHNPLVVEFFKTIGHSWVKDDETPWCAAYVGHVLESLGIPSTGRPNARSYQDWGDEVPLADAVPGDVCVFWRGSPNSWQGHVGFFHGLGGDTIHVLGGNQSNRVSVAPYPVARLLGVRRAPGVRLVSPELDRFLDLDGMTVAELKAAIARFTDELARRPEET